MQAWPGSIISAGVSLSMQASPIHLHLLCRYCRDDVDMWLWCCKQEMSEKTGVLLAFIVLDNPANSLLDMQTVKFVKDKPVLTSYLESFPFPYYIVLRDIAALPQTLAGLLRQWIQLSTN